MARRSHTAARPRARKKSGARSTEPTRDRILNASLQLFFDQGYEPTTVREITLACDLTPGALYNHFESKEEVLTAIILRAHDELEDQVLQAVARASNDPVAQLREMVHAFTAYHARYRLESRVSHRDFDALPPDQHAVIVARRRKVRTMFQSIIRRGADEGVFANPSLRDPIDASFITMSLINMCIYVVEWFDPAGEATVDRVASLHADLALRMLQSTTGSA